MFKKNRNPNAKTTKEYVAGSPNVSGYSDGLNGRRADTSMIGNRQYREGFEEGQRDANR